MRYPIYIPSRQRVGNMTAEMLMMHGLEFCLVVEEAEYDSYAKYYKPQNLLKLPSSNYGGVFFARNFIKNHARMLGYDWHWQLDDDIKNIYEMRSGVNTEIAPQQAFEEIEERIQNYVNLGMVGLSANTFVKFAKDEYQINKFAYTCFMVKTNLPVMWRQDVEDDLDFNLQCLTQNICTMRWNRFNFNWSATESKKGGYTDLYVDGQRQKRQQLTLLRWPFIPGIAKKAGGKTRLKTNTIWRQFKDSPKLIKQNA